MSIKLFMPSFNIKVASKPKRESKSSGSNISRKCYAIVAKIEGEYKAIVNYDNKYIHLRKGDELSNEQLILPFTKKSLDLKDKIYVFLKDKDKYGHYICVIRTSDVAHMSPGVTNQYDAVKENLLIAGHIVRKDGKMYFEYEDLIKYHYLSESFVFDVKIDTTKPLFNR